MSQGLGGLGSFQVGGGVECIVFKVRVEVGVLGLKIRVEVRV